ncbi:MAG TPA: hypothetical protein VGF77_05250 [Allosphingosinicella sp.]|jgi:hypothetical protein
MKKTMMALAAAAVTLTGVATAADASPFSQRETRIEKRIDQGARTGKLRRDEAAKLRMRLAGIRRIQQVRHHRMQLAKRQMLNHRLGKLSAQVRYEKHRRG